MKSAIIVLALSMSIISVSCNSHNADNPTNGSLDKPKDTFDSSTKPLQGKLNRG